MLEKVGGTACHCTRRSVCQRMSSIQSSAIFVLPASFGRTCAWDSPRLHSGSSLVWPAPWYCSRGMAAISHGSNLCWTWRLLVRSRIRRRLRDPALRLRRLARRPASQSGPPPLASSNSPRLRPWALQLEQRTRQLPALSRQLEPLLCSTPIAARQRRARKRGMRAHPRVGSGERPIRPPPSQPIHLASRPIALPMTHALDGAEIIGVTIGAGELFQLPPLPPVSTSAAE
jgi:hypothetical protein